MSRVNKFRIVTYNVHKCVGIDRRLDPARIVSALKEINAELHRSRAALLASDHLPIFADFR
jgi:endonuclease/exonuclease/phosphatase family metal-dependent hydrolase